MTATAPIRSATKRRLFDLLAAELTGFQVTYTEPAQFAPRSIWLGQATGASRPGALTAGRKIRMDDFTIEVHCLAYETTDDFPAIDEAAEALWGAVDDALATSPTLNLGGIALPGLIAATAGNWAGPSNGMIVVNDNVSAFSSEVIGQVSCTSRLT